MKRRRRLNWKVFLIALNLIEALVGGAYIFQKVRAERTLRAAREQAFEAAQRGDTEQAVRMMEGYLNFHRTDTAAVRDLAAVLDKTGKKPADRLKVLQLLDRALQFNPTDAETRRLAVKKSLELRRWKDASDHLQVLA